MSDEFMTEIPGYLFLYLLVCMVRRFFSLLKLA